MVPVSAWRDGNFKHLVVVRPQQLKQIVLIRGAIPVVPTTANLRYNSVITVKHPIVLSRTFDAQRFAAKSPAMTRISFKTQQARIRSIAILRPKVVPLPSRPVNVARPAHHPIVRAPIHPTAIKPVKLPVAKAVRPVRTHAPVVKPVKLPAAKAVKPVRTPAPVVKPVKHSAHKPAAHPSPKPSPTSS